MPQPQRSDHRAQDQRRQDRRILATLLRPPTRRPYRRGGQCLRCRRCRELHYTSSTTGAEEDRVPPLALCEDVPDQVRCRMTVSLTRFRAARERSSCAGLRGGALTAARDFGPRCSPSCSAGLRAHRRTGATGLEPATSGVTGRRSNQLSYAPRRARAEYSEGAAQLLGSRRCFSGRTNHSGRPTKGRHRHMKVRKTSRRRGDCSRRRCRWPQQPSRWPATFIGDRRATSVLRGTRARTRSTPRAATTASRAVGGDDTIDLGAGRDRVARRRGQRHRQRRRRQRPDPRQPGQRHARRPGRPRPHLFGGAGNDTIHGLQGGDLHRRRRRATTRSRATCPTRATSSAATASSAARATTTSPAATAATASTAATATTRPTATAAATCMSGGTGDDNQYGGAGNDRIFANQGVDDDLRRRRQRRPVGAVAARTSPRPQRRSTVGDTLHGGAATTVPHPRRRGRHDRLRRRQRRRAARHRRRDHRRDGRRTRTARCEKVVRKAPGRNAGEPNGGSDPQGARTTPSRSAEIPRSSTRPPALHCGGPSLLLDAAPAR